MSALREAVEKLRDWCAHQQSLIPNGEWLPTRVLVEELNTALAHPDAPEPVTPPQPNKIDCLQDPMGEFCQSEGPHGRTICMLPLGHAGACGWEWEKWAAARRDETPKTCATCKHSYAEGEMDYPDGWAICRILERNIQQPFGCSMWAEPTPEA